jgi:GxxExxY protein
MRQMALRARSERGQCEFARKHEGTRGRFAMHDVETLASLAIDYAMRLHQRLGPGLLESVYETMLYEHLLRAGYAVERQKALGIEMDGIRIADAFRIDLLVEGKLLIEVKSVEKLVPVHTKQLLTYLKLMDLNLGLLMNFNQTTLKEGLKRVINGPSAFVASRPRANSQTTGQDSAR